jgi:hypothetical protein
VGQRRAIATLLEYIIYTRAQLAEDNHCTDTLFEALETWADAARPS